MRQSTVQPQQNKKMLKDDSSGGPDCGNGETGKTVSQERIRSPQISKRKFDSMSPTTVTAVQVLESKTNTPSETFMDQQDKSNTNDVLQLIGQPHTVSVEDKNEWIFFERVLTKGDFIKLGQNVLEKNNVLVLKFNKYGILKDKKLIGKDSKNKVSFSLNETKNEMSQKSFVEKFLTSIRNKMYSNR